jgi:hypothetical protein
MLVQSVSPRRFIASWTILTIGKYAGFFSIA